MSDDARPSTPADRVAFTVDCRGQLRGVKLRALQAHATQTAGLISHVGEATFAQWWANESFVDATLGIEEPRRDEDRRVIAA
jgi:LmbE family N-acetylglucosaminyl deacetylase